jgi:hypothetical protein
MLQLYINKNIGYKSGNKLTMVGNRYVGYWWWVVRSTCGVVWRGVHLLSHMVVTVYEQFVLCHHTPFPINFFVFITCEISTNFVNN